MMTHDLRYAVRQLFKNPGFTSAPFGTLTPHKLSTIGTRRIERGR
jgi:hypothetical protein